MNNVVTTTAIEFPEFDEGVELPAVQAKRDPVKVMCSKMRIVEVGNQVRVKYGNSYVKFPTGKVLGFALGNLTEDEVRIRKAALQSKIAQGAYKHLADATRARFSEHASKVLAPKNRKQAA
ncbi:MAG: hypothetical protein H9535_19280 [Ignavibacteria bacterium]|nr:hypothetical protein [Ignavibacteria bacterium]